jgi:hypothetical protein
MWILQIMYIKSLVFVSVVGIQYICKYTRKNISHLVASLPTSRQQVVFVLLVPSCQQIWNKLLTTCNNLVDIIRLVASVFQQVRYSHDITVLLQPCVVNLVTFLLYHDYIMTVSDLLEQPCNKSDKAIKLVTSC